MSQFYLRDTRSDVGANAVFWNKDGAGYGSDLDRLEVYSIDCARSRHEDRETDVPLLKSLVDELSISRVDHQHVKSELIGASDSDDKYVVRVNGMVSGNDIGFCSDAAPTYDFKLARVYGLEELESPVFKDKSLYSIYSFSDIENVARRTFPSERFDALTMCKRAGIKLKRPKRQRPTTGKTRGNCPVCGKITWDYNPYENAYCINHDSSDL